MQDSAAQVALKCYVHDPSARNTVNIKMPVWLAAKLAFLTPRNDHRQPLDQTTAIRQS